MPVRDRKAFTLVGPVPLRVAIASKAAARLCSVCTASDRRALTEHTNLHSSSRRCRRGRPDTRAAATWILGALDAAKAERVDGIWRKAKPSSPESAATGSARPAASEQEKSEL